MPRCNEGCFEYAIYNDDGVVVADVRFDPSIIEKGDDTPCGLTISELCNMIRDLAEILDVMNLKQHVVGNSTTQ